MVEGCLREGHNERNLRKTERASLDGGEEDREEERRDKLDGRGRRGGCDSLREKESATAQFAAYQHRAMGADGPRARPIPPHSHGKIY